MTDARVKDFVGYAYFDDDGTFEMYNLDDSPKLQGDWTVSDDGKTRTIVAKDETGKELFTRDVDIRTLTDEESGRQREERVNRHRRRRSPRVSGNSGRGRSPS